MVGIEIKYFYWDDVKIEICKEMNIDEEYFRDYHELIGGEYKDLWHEWDDFFDAGLYGTIKHIDLDENMDSKIEYAKEIDKEWLVPFLEAVYKVLRDNKIEYIMYCND